VPAHVLAESFSVLTRLPAPHRLGGDVAGRLLARRFGPGDVLPASAALQRTAVAHLAGLGIEGGAVYDGLVGLTAKQHGQRLITRDRRAARTYELLEVDFELVDS